MPMTCRAWWTRAKWFFILYALIIVMAVFASPFDIALQGWRIAMLISTSAAVIGTLGSLRVITGKKQGHALFAAIENSGVVGIVSFEILHALYSTFLAFHDQDLSLVGRAAAHAVIAVSVTIAYRARPVRDKRYI